jgi:hypothetical protein
MICFSNVFRVARETLEKLGLPGGGIGRDLLAQRCRMKRPCLRA